MVRSLLFWLPKCTVCAVFVVLVQFHQLATASELDPITVEITTHLGDQQSFVEGDVISFLLSLSRGAYVYLFYRDATANLVQIYPNQQSASHFYEKGIYMPVPPPQTGFQFKIQAPFGDEKLFVFATDNADVKLNARPLVNGLSLMDGSIREIEAGIRRQSGLRFGSASLTIKSQSR